MAISNINMDGGALVYGKRNDGAGSWGKAFLPGQDVTVEMAYGNWNFSIISYAGPSKLTGARECAVLNNVIIGEENEVIDVTITASACGAAGVRELNFLRCTDAQFNSADPVTNCVELTGIESYRVRALEHRIGVSTSSGLLSDCIQEADFSGANAPKLPSGLTNIQLMPFQIIAYTGTNCNIGTGIVVDFPISLSNPTLSSFKAFADPSQLNLTLNNQGAGIDVTAPVVTISADSSILGNGFNWINAASVSAFNVSGACSENGVSVDFFVNNIPFGTSATCAGSSYNQNFDFTGYADTGTVANLNFEARQTDTAGNVGTIALILNKDTLAPTSGLPLSWTESNGTASASATLTANFNLGADTGGAGVSNNQIDAYASASCGGGPIATTNLPPPTSSQTVPGTDGTTYTFTVTTTDFAGNSAATSTCSSSVLVDTTFPAAPIVSGANALGGGAPYLSPGTTTTGNWTVSVSGDIVGQRVELHGANCSGPLSSTTLSSASSSSTFTALSEITYSFRVVAIDIAGNETTSTCSNNRTFDQTPPNNASFNSIVGPALSMGPNIGIVFNEGTDSNLVTNYNVKFYNDGSCTSLIDTVNVSDDGSTTFTATSITPPDGGYQIVIETIDTAGLTNSTACSGTLITLDTVSPPDPSGVSWATATPTKQKSVNTNSWTVSGDTNTVDINLYSGGSCAGNLVNSFPGLNAGSTFNYNFNVTEANDYYFSVRAYDLAGNSSNEICSAVLSISQEGMHVGGRYVDGFVIGNNYLYAVTPGGLETYDVSVLESFPSQIELEHVNKIPGFEADRGDHFNNFIYMYDSTSADMHVLTTVGTGSLDAPAYVGMMNTGFSNIIDHTFSAGYMWLLDSSNQIYGLDISSPGTLGTLGTNIGPIALGETSCLSLIYEATVDYLFIGCNILIKPVNISTPASPALQTAVNPDGGNSFVITDLVAGDPNNIYAGGNDGTGHVMRIAVNSPTAPARANAVRQLAGPIRSMGNYNTTNNDITACSDATSGDDQAYVIDVTPGAMPIRNSLSSNTTNRCTKTLTNDFEVFGLSWDGGIVRAAVNAGTTADTTPYLPGSMRNIAVEPGGTWAVATAGTEGLSAFNLIDPYNPIQFDEFAGNYNAVVANGSTAYVAAGTLIKRLVVTGGGSPSATFSTDINVTRSTNNTTGMAISPSSGAAGILYVGHTDGAMSVVNLATNTKILDIIVCSGAVSVKDITVQADSPDKVYALCSDGEVRGFNNTNPTVSFTAITGAVGAFTLPATGTYDGITLTQSTLYIAHDNNGTEVYNVAVPTSPSFVTNLAGNTANSARVYGSVLYVAIGQGGLKSWNISSPNSPILLDSYTAPGTPGSYNSMAPSDSSPTPTLIYQATGLSGIEVINIQDPSFMHQ
jgi:hypothetical protein